MFFSFQTSETVEEAPTTDNPAASESNGTSARTSGECLSRHTHPPARPHTHTHTHHAAIENVTCWVTLHPTLTLSPTPILATTAEPPAKRPKLVSYDDGEEEVRGWQ